MFYGLWGFGWPRVVLVSKLRQEEALLRVPGHCSGSGESVIVLTLVILDYFLKKWGRKSDA